MAWWKAVWRGLVGTSPNAHPERAAPWESVDDDGEEQPVDPSEPVVVPIEDALDLHTFQPREIVQVVDEYLQAAREKGFGEVRVIHGRGKGVQRARVRSLLKKHAAVEDFHSAPGSRGGWGATIVLLKPPKK